MAPPTPDSIRMARQRARAGRYSAVGIEMCLAVGLGVVGGDWIDNRMGTAPWGVLLGFALGLGAAARAVGRIIAMHRAEPP
jgi:F0F1-type ATP synthase assembly protein I